MKYRFWLISDGFSSACTGDVSPVVSEGIGKQVYPDWSGDTSFTWEPDEEYIYYRMKLDDIVFKNKCKLDSYDYDCLYALELNENVDLYVEKEISGTYETIYHGRFSRQNCKYDEDIETVTVKTEPVDEYEGYMEGGDVQYNILRIPRKYVVDRSGGDPEIFDFTIRIRDAIRYILDHMNSGLNYTSTFFESAVNPVTSANPNPLNNLVIAHKSDVIAEAIGGGFVAATVGNISLNELLDILKNLYDIRWDVINGFLRVEHVSFYTETLGDLDLTTEENNFSHKEYSWRTNKYNYKDLPNREEFQYSEKDDFRDYFYDMAMAGDDIFVPQEKKITTHLPKNCTNDLDYICDNPTEISTDGWVIMEITDVVGVWTVLWDNANLDWDNLTTNYWMHNRPYKYAIHGRVNLDPDTWAIRTMTTKRNGKVQENLIMDGCDTVWGGTFDAAELVRTELGDGKIQSMRYNLSSGQLQLSLLHDIEDNKIPEMPFYFEEETELVFNYMVETPEWEDKLILNTFIKSLIDDGVWANLSFLFIFAGHTIDNSEALINIITPSDSFATLNGGLAAGDFVQWEGLTTDGVADYIDLLQKVTGGSDTTMGFYTRTADDAGGPYIDMGATNGVDYEELGHTGGPPMTQVALTGPVSSFIDNDAAGMKTIVRSAAANVIYYKDKVSAVKVNANNGISNFNIYVGALSNSGAAILHSAKQYSMAFGGVALSAGEQGDLFDAFDTYMTAHGTAV